MWLSWLPIRTDVLEARVNDMAAAEEAVDDEDFSTISKEAKSKLRELLAKFQAQFPCPVVQNARAKLSGDEQHALSHL
ncbi:hypothetical protein PsorP6_011120 [Peronosclerospora sorghi]|uniref:Uncharacterized protein n=1 Tax=Peronosclerospora sorghi TaxID=230839 RepID=A0ACC0VWZ6_9STRA|nr:hypothetical protein PsorP6_011120 [Peronosclerospora sorghi]